MKLKKTLLFLVIFQSINVFARDHEIGMGRRGGGGAGRRGNEGSVRVDRLRVGQAAHGGSGCPQGTMSVSFAPDNLSFTILFDQFIAQTTPVNGVSKEVLACEMLIPIEIPENTQMEITRVDLRGFANLPLRTRGVVTSMFNFRGSGGDRDRMVMRYLVDGPLTDNYFISSDQITNGETEISPCGGSTQLKVVNHIKVISQRGLEAQMSLDSIDGTGNAIYYVNWKSCKKEVQPTPSQPNPNKPMPPGGRPQFPPGRR